MFNLRSWLFEYYLLTNVYFCLISAQRHFCTTCDDNISGCMPEDQVNETCESGANACMVELYFTPDKPNAFNFRSRCGSPDYCPARYPDFMCTPFEENEQTCRICCFENNCHDATPRSPLRLKIMRQLLEEMGKSPDDVERFIDQANQFAEGMSANPPKTTLAASAPQPTSAKKVDTPDARPPANVKVTSFPSTQTQIRQITECNTEPAIKDTLPKTRLPDFRPRPTTSTSTSTASLPIAGCPLKLILAIVLLGVLAS